MIKYLWARRYPEPQRWLNLVCHIGSLSSLLTLISPNSVPRRPYKSGNLCNLLKLDSGTLPHAVCGHLNTFHKGLAQLGEFQAFICTLGQLKRSIYDPCTSWLDCTVPSCRYTFSCHQLVIERGAWAPPPLNKVGEKRARMIWYLYLQQMCSPKQGLRRVGRGVRTGRKEKCWRKPTTMAHDCS